MEYEVKYLQDRDIVAVKLKGRLNFQMAEKYSKEAVKLARQKYYTKFLVDHSETIVKDESTNIHVSAGELQQFGFQNTDRVAILLSDPDKFTHVANLSNQNSRWCLIKNFSVDDYDKALEWLEAAEEE